MGFWQAILAIVRPSRAATAAPDPLPRVLYKYLPVERCHHWLQERTVAFVALELLNDPYEGVIVSLPYADAGAVHVATDRPVVRYRVGQMVDYAVNPTFDPDARDRRVRAQDQRNRELEARRLRALDSIKSCRILSLCHTPDNMVMWAHYASNSRGLCIGIDWAKANLLVSSDTRGHSGMRPLKLAVEYKDHPFESRFDHHEDSVAYALGRKHTHWAYEREVRMLRHVSDFARYAPQADKRVGLLVLPPDSVTDIVLGAAPDVSVRTLLRDEVKHFPDAKIRQLEISGSGYQPRLRHIDDLRE